MLPYKEWSYCWLDLSKKTLDDYLSVSTRCKTVKWNCSFTKMCIHNEKGMEKGMTTLKVLCTYLLMLVNDLFPWQKIWGHAGRVPIFTAAKPNCQSNPDVHDSSLYDNSVFLQPLDHSVCYLFTLNYYDLSVNTSSLASPFKLQGISYSENVAKEEMHCKMSNSKVSWIIQNGMIIFLCNHH